MRRTLGAKLKFEFLDGTIPMSVDSFDPLHRAWNRCNMLIHSWIMNSVDPSIAQSIVFMENAADVWLDLKERFSQGDLVRISELQQEIYSLKQDSRTVTEFFSELKILWEELEIYMPIPTCTCRSKCVCEAMRTARRNHQLLHSMRFITGLNDNFGVVKSQILLRDPLPSINKIFSMILQHERQLIPTFSEDSKALINTSESKKLYQKSGKSFTKSKPRVCTYCNKSGHTVDTCYKKHGLPPHLQRSNSSGTASEGSAFTTSDAAPVKGPSPSLTHEQYEKLIHLIQGSSLNQQLGNVASNQVRSIHSSGLTPVDSSGIYSVHSISCFHSSCHNTTLGSWIIDSGDSHHICSSLQWFHSYSEITPILVKLPNGQHTVTKFMGTVTFSPGFTILNVLYVPDFSVNLISVSELCHNLIGSAERLDGLYYLLLTNKKITPSINANQIPQSALWHFRLGHLSHPRLLNLKEQFPFIVSDQKAICDVCHFAKHRKSSFPHSTNKALKPYDLIHFDIWVPFPLPLLAIIVIF
ncbi:uncharacterized protein LOC131605858 [Vicia villosa]|uniref:uncharacterized protein LOC131605858 n=1 Tax=Vicia villosa TaxID=3911 RepID=UPI00273AADB8|nr:uncharacterized protein LOC131605858 [Vicia villosa]